MSETPHRSKSIQHSKQQPAVPQFESPIARLKRTSLRDYIPNQFIGDAFEKVTRGSLTNIVSSNFFQPQQHQRSQQLAPPAASTRARAGGSSGHLRTSSGDEEDRPLTEEEFQRRITSMRNNLEAELHVCRGNMEEIAAIRRFKAEVLTLAQRLEIARENDVDDTSDISDASPLKYGVHKGLVMSRVNRLDDGRKTRLSGVSSNQRTSKESKFDPRWLLDEFCEQRLCKPEDAIELINKARALMANEDNVLQIDAPVAVVGDIHGQFFDLVKIFDMTGPPSRTNPYLFLGDYVDRGKFSCEVMLLLFAFKVQQPEHVFLIRGNHECRSVSGYFGFKEECKVKYGLQVYYQFLLAFQAMPLAAQVHTSFGSFFASHGGLSPSIKTVSQINAIDRFVEPDLEGPLCDLLWSDPDDDFGGGSDSDSVASDTDSHSSSSSSTMVPIEAPNNNNNNSKDNNQGTGANQDVDAEWSKNAARGCSYKYSGNAVKKFLKNNKLVCLVRAHEVVKEGYRYHFGANTQLSSLLSLPSFPLPIAITIFSAPNYCDTYGNQASILRIAYEREHLELITFSAAESPAPRQFSNQTKNTMQCIAEACPYMPTTFGEFVRVVADLGEDSSNKKKKDPGLVRRRSSLGSFDCPTTDQRFEIAMHHDAINELHPDAISDRMSEAGVVSDDDLTLDDDLADTPSAPFALPVLAFEPPRESNHPHERGSSDAVYAQAKKSALPAPLAIPPINPYALTMPKLNLLSTSSIKASDNVPQPSPRTRARRSSQNWRLRAESFGAAFQKHKNIFTEQEFKALGLLFSLMDREGSGKISLEAMADASEEIDGRFNMNDVRMAMITFGSDGQQSFDFDAYISVAIRLKDIHTKLKSEFESTSSTGGLAAGSTLSRDGSQALREELVTLIRDPLIASSQNPHFFVESISEFGTNAQEAAQRRVPYNWSVSSVTSELIDPSVLDADLKLRDPHGFVVSGRQDSDESHYHHVHHGGLMDLPITSCHSVKDMDTLPGEYQQQPVDVWVEGPPASASSQANFLVNLTISRFLPPHDHILKFVAAGTKVSRSSSTQCRSLNRVMLEGTFPLSDREISTVVANRLPDHVTPLTPHKIADSQMAVNLRVMDKRRSSDGSVLGPVYDGESEDGRNLSLLVRKSVASLATTNLEDTFVDISILKSLNHPNICQIVGVSYSDTPETSRRPSESFEVTIDAPKFYVALQTSIHGTLREVLKYASWTLRIRICYDIACALQYIHSKSIVYRFLTLDTVVIDHDWHAKLSDFRLSMSSELIETGALHAVNEQKDIQYSVTHVRSPEEIRRDCISSAGLCDMFSFGLLMLETITLRHVDAMFPSRSLETEWGVSKEEVRGEVLEGCPPSLVELTLQLLSGPDFRPDADSAKDWLESLLEDVGGKGLISVPTGLLLPRNKLHLVTEPCPLGSLKRVMHTVDLSWPLRVRLAADIASGLNHLHSNNIIHCNLHSFNILVSTSWRAKLFGFHYALTVDACNAEYQGIEKNQNDPNRVSSKPPLSFYSSPEVLRGEACGTASDMFAFGLVLLELVTGRDIDESFPERELFPQKYSVEETTIRASISSLCPMSLVGLISQLLLPDADLRPDAVAAKDWLEAVGEKLDKVEEPLLSARLSHALEPNQDSSSNQIQIAVPQVDQTKGEQQGGKLRVEVEKRSFTYAELRRIIQRQELEKYGMDVTRLESYLTVEEFWAVFHATIEEFEVMPYWKRRKAKTDARLA